ncbi:MAG: hypothetical protein WC378_04505 [Opitutaceae bacterium]|jgi:hypothetical protein
MPTPWITLSVEQLATAKAAALVDALRTAALGDGQDDPLPEILSGVVTRIRAEIAAGGRTRLDVSPTKLPPSLKALALRMALREAQSRVNAGGALPLSDDEKEEWRQDLRYLERIAKGEITVEESDSPETAPTVQASTPSPLITARDRRFTRHDQDGI